MIERPIKRGQRGPAVSASPAVATGGDDLTLWIVAIDVYRLRLGYAHWADLAPLCGGEDPKTLDLLGLALLLGELRKIQESSS
jgi:hypothetical protein